MWTSSSSGIKYLASLAGAFMRPVQERLQDRLSVKDFGAQGDGVTDDFPAILAAIKAIAVKGGELYFPAGVYRISKAIPFVNNVVFRGEGYASCIKPLDSSAFGIFGEAYPSKFCELNNWTANSRFNQQYDSAIASFQNSDGSVGSVSRSGIINMRLDGNKSIAPFNTFNAGSSDDAYQNLIRMDCVQSSVFRDLILDNSVYNALSVYDSSNDNLFENILINTPGKSGIGAGLSANGVYIEFTSRRNKFNNIYINTPLMYGLLIKAASGVIEDIDLRNVMCVGCPMDGIRIGDDATGSTGSIYRVSVYAPRLVNCGTSAGYTGLRVAHSGTGYVYYTKITSPYVAGGGASGSVVIHANAIGTTVETGVVTGSLSDAYRALTGSVETQFLNCASYGNTGAHFNTTGSTRAFVVAPIINGLATQDAYQNLRVVSGSGTAPKVMWSQSGVGDWEAAIAPSTNRWYLYGLGVDQISIDSSGIKLGTGAWNGTRLLLGSYHLWVDSSGRLRIKSSAPTSDTDGAIVGAQT